MPDLQTLLAKFLIDLYAGTFGTTVPVSSLTLTGPGSGVVLTNPATNQLQIAGNLIAGDLNAGAASFIGFVGRSYFNSPLNGQMVLGNALSTAGVGFDVVTDGTLKVLTRAMADSAIVNASRFSSGANLGVVTFGPAAVASITVRGGLVTAIS